MRNLLIIADGLIDGTGRDPIRDPAVLIEDGIIKMAGRRDLLHTTPAGASCVDLTGLVLMPGLVNCHEHLALHRAWGSEHAVMEESIQAQLLRSVRNALFSLTTGVTTIREVGARGGTDLSLKFAIEAGMVLGPRVKASGPAICMTGGHGYQICREVDGPVEARKAARQNLKEGADWLKLMATAGVGRDLSCPPELTVEEMAAAVEAAHHEGRRVCAHATSQAGIQNALEAGVDSIEHGKGLGEEQAALAARKGVFLVTTLSTFEAYVEVGEQQGEPTWLVERCRQALGCDEEAVRVAMEFGMPIACGTDSRGSMSAEVKLLRRAGMDAMQSLVSATAMGARLLGLSDQLGTVEQGKVADLIAVEGDPLDDPDSLNRVREVFLSGRRFTVSDLRHVMGDLPSGPWGNLRT
jgi:imidazolonepropionase-like amidohydrolase